MLADLRWGGLLRGRYAAMDSYANITPDDGGEFGSAPHMDWAFTQSPFALAIHDRDLLCLRVNDRMCQMFGLTERELRGRRLTDVLPGAQYSALEHYMRQVLEEGKPKHRETYRRVPGETRERAWSVSVSPLKDQAGRTQAVWIGVLNVTEQYAARQRLTLLNQAGTYIGTTLDVTRTAQELADMAVPQFADLAVVDLLDAVLSGDEPDPGPLTGTVALRRVAHQSIFEGVPEAVVKPGDVDVHPESSSSARCLATGKPILTGVNDPTFTSATGHNPARAATIRKYGLHSILSVPIRARGVTLGVAVFLRGQRPEPFEQDDVLLAEELTARAALSLDNARRYTRERTTALALQRSLLPQRLPEQSAVEVASRYLPASAHAGVGGDWFDVIPLSGARVALVVGDVVGHGIRASATMGRLRTAVRTLADVDLPPDELLTRLDDLVSPLSAEADAGHGDDADNDVGATCLYAVYDPVSRRCSLARAGHPLPVLVTPDGAVGFLDLPAGPPLGLGGLPFESTEIELPAGSILALYTDGLIESRDHDIDLGLERLRRALTHPAPSLETTCTTSSRLCSPPVRRTTSPCSSPGLMPWTATGSPPGTCPPTRPSSPSPAGRWPRGSPAGASTMRRSSPDSSSANSSPTRSGMPRARSSSVSSGTGRSSARSPTAAAPPRTSAGPAPSTRAAAVCSLSPSSPSAGEPARRRTARPSGPNKPSPVVRLVMFEL